VEVVRLETTVRRRAHPHPDHASFSAQLDAVLADGRRIVLLDDRGWSESPAAADHLPDDLAFTARTVVGPDEGEDVAGYWGSLARKLDERGIAAEASALAALPHGVVLGWGEGQPGAP
jgi:hypothetical protein